MMRYLLFLLWGSLFVRVATAQKWSSPPAPDYSRLADWAANPAKENPSDLIPRPFRKSPRDSSVDVFFIHPTTYTRKMKKGEDWNASLQNQLLNQRTDRSTILYQASVFNGCCRIYAPRYRQANLQAFFLNNPALKKRIFDTAYQDVKMAFQYYLQHDNHGRPIIIASHSQGTVHAGRLLKEFFEGKPLMHQLVAAYLIGMPIPRNYFSSLPPCRDSTQTGCFVGWRTFERGYDPPSNHYSQDSSWCTNPLTWTLDTTLASSQLQLGSILLRFNKLIRTQTSAQIHRGILWISKPRVPGSFLIHNKNYHIGDINLFYANIRKNLRQRIAHYWKQKQDSSARIFPDSNEVTHVVQNTGK
ncbi:MAG: DUF3089 domain-containing protein [Chitinophagaceae bacterium]